MLKILLICALLLVGFIMYEGIRFALLIQKGKEVIEKAVRFERPLPDSSESILVVGDSTGFGTGTDDSLKSIAGRLATFYPEAEIINRSENGMKLMELREALRVLPEGEAYDLLLLQIGGNDILQFTRVEDVERDAREALRIAKRHGKHVILMSAGNVGSAPAFDALFSRIYEARTRVVREVFIRIAQEEDASYVDLFEERVNDPFVKEPERYHAKDGLHPTGEGYGLWFEKLEPLLPPSFEKGP